MSRILLMIAWLGTLAPMSAADDPFFIRGGQRVLFLGDSITNNGGYIRDIDAYLTTRFPGERFELINLGLSSETVSGLSEPDHPFPRPNVHERLERALTKTKPDIVVACYGMNDGIYHPFDESRFQKYRDGIETLVDRVRQSGAKLVLLTPPPFDAGAIPDKVQPLGAAKYGWLGPYVGYDETLIRYGEWLLTLRDRGILVVDPHAVVARHLASVRAGDPKYRLSGDGVHMDATGQWLIAQALLPAWKAKADVDDAEIDAKDKLAKRGQVADLAISDGVLRFTWTSRVPMPHDPSWDPKLVERERIASNFNRYRLTVTGLEAPRYELFEGDTRLGVATREQLAQGLDLLTLPKLSTNQHAAALWPLIEKRERLMSAAWLTDVGHKRPDTPQGLPLDEARKQAEPLSAEIERLAQPVALALRLVPLRDQAVFRAGAAAVDVTPPKLPVLVNGGFLQVSADKVNDTLNARCLVLDDASVRLAIVVVDSCMLPRELIDRAKDIAAMRTSIPAERILVSATHTHTAPAAMGALGCSPDSNYVEFLPERIADAIEKAAKNLVPARVGWGSIDDDQHTHCRRWIRRPDKIITDPFGNRTVRANMHPGHQNADVIAPAGPVDPGLSVLSVQATDGRPIAVLANYSMHYFGTQPVSADYFGRFSTTLSQKLGADKLDPPFVAMMSQGTSGDQQWMDYAKPKSAITIDAYADAVAEGAFQACKSVVYRDQASIAMAEAKLELRRRVPDEKRLAWAKPIAEKLGDNPPRSIPEVYAREAFFLHREPQRELKLQAIRIGELAIAAIPNEVYAITGLKIKAWSPLPATFTIELANGSEGYIPPPEQHFLGGYTTWPARTAALEVEAEPKIVETVLGLLEAVAGKPRRGSSEAHGAYARAILDDKPVAYWRFSELRGPDAADSSGHGRVARYGDGIAFYLEGPASPEFNGAGMINRAPHIAGGNISASIPGVAERSTVEFWFWNGLPSDVRGVTAYLAALGAEDRLAIGGTAGSPGRLLFSRGNAAPLAGNAVAALKVWFHVAIVRDGSSVIVYVNGEPDIRGNLDRHAAQEGEQAYSFGARHDGGATLEGKLDEVAVFDRALTAAEVARHYAASGMKSKPAAR
jgi:lysophospholipase L1-like esterase